MVVLAVLAVLAILVVYFLMVLGGAWIVDVSLEAITQTDIPYWPVFWILVVLIAFVRGGSYRKS